MLRQFEFTTYSVRRFYPSTEKRRKSRWRRCRHLISLNTAFTGFQTAFFENCRGDRAQFTRSTFFRARHKKGGEAGKGGAHRKSPPSPPFTPFHWPFWKSVMDGYAQDHKTVGFCVGKRVKTASTLARTGPPRHFLGCGLTESTALNLRFKLKTLEVT